MLPNTLLFGSIITFISIMDQWTTALYCRPNELTGQETEMD